ncbi:hypothetical protein KW797_04125, partial [Candidatus Parcubacteria bacterium]|nr:hypothetical protein [Candidatus Parcubacteria bacterium]
MEVEKDNKGHTEKISPLKDISLTTSRQPGTETLSLRRRADKLSTAAYLLTEHMGGEAVRSRIRECALGMLGETYALANPFLRGEKRERSISLSLAVEELIGLFSICRLAGLISESNNSLMQRELVSFNGALEPFASEEISFPGIFESIAPPSAANDLSFKAVKEDKGHFPIKDTLVKDNIRDINIKDKRPIETRKREGSANVSGDRRDTILKLIRKDKEASI